MCVLVNICACVHWSYGERERSALDDGCVKGQCTREIEKEREREKVNINRERERERED